MLRRHTFTAFVYLELLGENDLIHHSLMTLGYLVSNVSNALQLKVTDDFFFSPTDETFVLLAAGPEPSALR